MTDRSSVAEGPSRREVLRLFGATGLAVGGLGVGGAASTGTVRASERESRFEHCDLSEFREARAGHARTYGIADSAYGRTARW